MSDPQKYRPKDEVEEYKEKDPIEHVLKVLQNQEDDQAQRHRESAAQRTCATPARQAPTSKRGSRLGKMLEATR